MYLSIIRYVFTEKSTIGSLSLTNNYSQNNWSASTTNRGWYLNLDASASNPIYGKSSTVTPASTTLYPWVVAYAAAVPASTAQAAEFQQGLSGKADTNLGNTTPSQGFKEMSVGWSMPDYSAVVSKSINVDYTEATNGFLVIDYTDINTHSEFSITINGTSFNFYQGYSGMDYNHCNVGFIPIPKNTTYKITKGTNIRAIYFPCIGG